MLRARSLHKGFGSVVALDGMDLEIRPGEIVGLIGHNGAGKSTFVDIAAGLTRPDSGAVEVAGIDVGRSPRQARARLGVAPQQLALYPKATGLDNLRLFAGLHGLRGRRQRDRIDEVAGALGLSGLLDRQVESLSGGQQRRLQTATALLPEPPVLLLDEPTVGADLEARADLLSMVRRQAGRGAAICYTTHYLTELRDLDATIAVLARGQIIARGTQAKLLAGLPSVLWLRLRRPPLAAVTEYPGCAMAGGDVLTLATRNPGQDLALFLRRFRDTADSLVGVEVVAPTLEDFYQHLLGRDRGVELNNVD